MRQPYRVLALGGDGIGPEVLASGLAVLEAITHRGGLSLTIKEDLIHGAAWEARGVFCRDECLKGRRHDSRPPAAAPADL
ncbi:MAG: isocitrate/isopropylmalate family dehydrogenase [Paracoccaceae bacterium]|nr:isocitrate/isopropylmalate family dehydrogenase [Paracoccaceae bacterium]